MSEHTDKLDELGEKVERQVARVDSLQPRFTTPQQVFAATYKWVTQAYMEEPEYKPDTRKRDKWLRQFWRLEPYLMGVIATIVMQDKNRSWVLVGGQRMVNRYQLILREAENGQGWRRYASKQSLSYHTSDLGAVTEVGRDGGALRALYHVDPVRFKKTGDPNEPGRYFPVGGKSQFWKPSDFFVTTGLPSDDEQFFDVGYCSLSRALELAKIMVALYTHDHEMLGSRAPKGLLLLNNIGEDQWEEAMKSRGRKLDGMERAYFGGVAVLASAGMDQIDAKLLGLSQLPAGFDQQTFTDLLMYGYALVFGVDIGEIWQGSKGGLSRSAEAEIQHQKATGKGLLTFPLDYSDQLTMPGNLPDTLDFYFEERDVVGKLQDAEVFSVYKDVVTGLYESGLSDGNPLITREEARALLAEAGIIPREWTEMEEEAEAKDREQAMIKRWRRLYRGNPKVRLAASQFPQEPIVRYQYPTHRATVVYKEAQDVLKKAIWAVPDLSPKPSHKRPLSRQRHKQYTHREAQPGDVLFEEDEVVITTGDVELAVEELLEEETALADEFAEALTNTPYTEDELDELEANS